MQFRKNKSEKKSLLFFINLISLAFLSLFSIISGYFLTKNPWGKFLKKPRLHEGVFGVWKVHSHEWHES